MKYTENHLKQLVSMIPNFEKENINERSEITKQINREKFEWRAFFELTRDMVCVVDTRLNVVKMNDFWAEKLGYTGKTIRGKCILEFIHAEDIEVVKEVMHKGDMVESINRVVLKDNTIRWLSWKSVITEFRQEKVYIGIARDITEHKKSVSKRLELQKDLTREKHRNLFFSTLSHEFKTPLNIILSVNQIMDKSLQVGEIIEDEADTLKRYIDLIGRNSYKTLKTANNLIDLIKMDSRTEKLNFDYYNVIDIVEEITMAAIRYSGNSERSIVFDTEVEEYLSWCDDGAIERIMLNLLSNAIKFSKPGGQIIVYIKEYEKCISIYVEDKGEGITLEGITLEGEEILDVDQFIWQKGKIGLGLKIVEQLVNIHKGNLFIESKRGTGTKVGFTLPRLECDKVAKHRHRGDLRIRHNEKCQIELCDI